MKRILLVAAVFMAGCNCADTQWVSQCDAGVETYARLDSNQAWAVFSQPAMNMEVTREIASVTRASCHEEASVGLKPCHEYDNPGLRYSCWRYRSMTERLAQYGHLHRMR